MSVWRSSNYDLLNIVVTNDRCSSQTHSREYYGINKDLWYQRAVSRRIFQPRGFTSQSTESSYLKPFIRRRSGRIAAHLKPVKHLRDSPCGDSPPVEGPPALRAVLCQGCFYCLLLLLLLLCSVWFFLNLHFRQNWRISGLHDWDNVPGYGQLLMAHVYQ